MNRPPRHPRRILWAAIPFALLALLALLAWQLAPKGDPVPGNWDATVEHHSRMVFTISYQFRRTAPFPPPPRSPAALAWADSFTMAPGNPSPSRNAPPPASTTANPTTTA